MVDFKKRLTKKEKIKPLDPLELYETLDRASDKGPLRPAQKAVLKEWHHALREEKDIIVKLHTGQGKTLIGLLMLLSKMNENEGSSLYICPNKYLARQTFIQAHQFGIKCDLYDDEIPESFTDGTRILISHVQVLFNGKTKFGVGPKYTKVHNIILDDAHACIDSIKSSFTITMSYQHHAFQEILQLFANDLKEQGVGTYSNILNNEYDEFLSVPYWSWFDKKEEVAKILANHSKTNEIKYAWPIIKDIIGDCLCVISGQSLHIQPYSAPLHLFGSYDKAGHRIFMSATVTDDSFLVKGLGLSESTVKNPLTFIGEKWSGEKMILIPSLLDKALTREVILEEYSKPDKERQFGIVVLCPSFPATDKWKAKEAIVAKSENIEQEIDKLKRRICERPLVIANRYDGIDLPDRSCRILILDGKPFSETLVDRYYESCRESSDIIATNLARTIEQGLGRSVRGEKDYCAIIVIGSDLVRCVRSKEYRKFLSAQTQKQIEIGLEVADMAKEEIEDGVVPIKALNSLVNQSLKRDEGWKEFYVEEMDKIVPSKPSEKTLLVFTVEMKADKFYRDGNYDKAVAAIQELIDKHVSEPSEKGWYLQEIARYIYPKSKAQSNTYQIAAHKANTYLLKPQEGMEITKMGMIPQQRIENIKSWITKFGSKEDVYLFIDEMLSNLRFGVIADKFEKSFNDLGHSLGFEAQRPDKEWKAGPDNLWSLKQNTYLLVECKNEVKATRKEIYKEETGQMNNACAWFSNNYNKADCTNIIIAPVNKIGKAAGFNKSVSVMLPKQLDSLCKNVKAFFDEFKDLDLHDISDAQVEKLLQLHKLTVDDLQARYAALPSN